MEVVEGLCVVRKGLMRHTHTHTHTHTGWQLEVSMYVKEWGSPGVERRSRKGMETCISSVHINTIMSENSACRYSCSKANSFCSSRTAPERTSSRPALILA